MFKGNYFTIIQVNNKLKNTKFFKEVDKDKARLLNKERVCWIKTVRLHETTYETLTGSYK